MKKEFYLVTFYNEPESWGCIKTVWSKGAWDADRYSEEVVRLIAKKIIDNANTTARYFHVSREITLEKMTLLQ